MPATSAIAATLMTTIKIIATDLFHIEKREKTEYVVTEDPGEPFGVYNGSAFFLQAFDDSHVRVVVAVKVIGDQIRILKDDVLYLLVRIIFPGIQKLIAHPKGSSQRLGWIAGANGVEHSLQDRRCNLRTVSRSGLIIDVPNTDSGIILVLCDDFADHVEVVIAFLGIVKIEMRGNACE